MDKIWPKQFRLICSRTHQMIGHDFGVAIKYENRKISLCFAKEHPQVRV